MNALLLQIAFYVLVVATLIGFFRLVKGPAIVDRIMAFDAVVLCAVGLIVLLSRSWETPLFLELILIVSSLGFFGTVAFVSYLQRTLPETEDEAGESGGDENKKEDRR
ncbi:monovalent cation/H+ antiporter complex subunit F [Geminisphaera colitermitum]|uniref:monovalent cation/H+ antiporter complex subunit F n=1 Tax=Geminisphaera colitermitum TaxID=1148786 RepID=UPI000158D618|nr:monovalent cation/H+ antiporter complex subunit F [Geminisphaera colitermitum]